jgi:hypothetical protein
MIICSMFSIPYKLAQDSMDDHSKVFSVLSVRVWSLCWHVEHSFPLKNNMEDAFYRMFCGECVFICTSFLYKIDMSSK